MQSLSNKDPDQANADSFATLFDGRLSLWFSTKQPRQLPVQKSVVANKLETSSEEYPSHLKLSQSQYQEQDSSSTLSSGQSQNISFQPGFVETYKKRGEGCLRPSLQCGNIDFISHQVQMEHHQSLDCMPYPLAGPYFSRIAAPYDPNAVVYAQMMGVTPARNVLPLDCTEDIPIYVNAKQYHAILRRRQTRAKLETQNKMAKSRKPYLHESRHHHALKRARGSGGRFLNTKNMQQQQQKTPYDNNNLSLHHHTTTTDNSNSGSWGASTPSAGSDVSSIIFNTDDIFQQPHLGVSLSSLEMGPTSVLSPDDRLMLTVAGRTRISAAI